MTRNLWDASLAELMEMHNVAERALGDAVQACEAARAEYNRVHEAVYRSLQHMAVMLRQIQELPESPR